MTCGSSDFGVYRTCHFWKFPNLEISRNGYCSARVNAAPAIVDFFWPNLDSLSGGFSGRGRRRHRSHPNALLLLFPARCATPAPLDCASSGKEQGKGEAPATKVPATAELGGARKRTSRGRRFGWWWNQELPCTGVANPKSSSFELGFR